MTDLMDNMISEEEAAQMLGFSRQWLRNVRLKGDGPVYMKIANQVFYDPEDIKTWLQSQKQKPTKAAKRVKKDTAESVKKAAARTAKSKPKPNGADKTQELNA